MKASAKGFESYFLEIMAMKKATRVSSPDIPRDVGGGGSCCC